MNNFKRRNFRALKVIIPTILLVTLNGCAPPTQNIARHPHSHPHTDDLSYLQELASNSNKKLMVSGIKSQAIRDTALSIGARGGLAWRAKIINKETMSKERYLNRAFNFRGLMLDDNVLPPVLTEGNSLLNPSSDSTLRISDKVYAIKKQAKFVTAPPSWRDYIWLNFLPPEEPDQTLLPRNSQEIMIWKKYVREGWVAGINQANLIYKERLNNLTQDLKGMILYRKLLAQNMVSAPFVAKMNMGITGGGNNIAINDRILKITAFPQLQPDGEEWKTRIKPNG